MSTKTNPPLKIWFNVFICLKCREQNINNPHGDENKCSHNLRNSRAPQFCLAKTGTGTSDEKYDDAAQSQHHVHHHAERQSTSRHIKGLPLKLFAVRATTFNIQIFKYVIKYYILCSEYDKAKPAMPRIGLPAPKEHRVPETRSQSCCRSRFLSNCPPFFPSWQLACLQRDLGHLCPWQQK